MNNLTEAPAKISATTTASFHYDLTCRFAFGLPQNPISQRPPKERGFIKDVKKGRPPITCEEHEWAVFNKEVKEVEAAAAKHFEEREKGPMSLGRVSRVMERIDSILSFITGEGGEFDPGDGGDSWTDLLNKQTKITEIEAGTQQAAKMRDQRIKVNCKKP